MLGADENTLFKVRSALIKVGGEKMADDAICEMQLQGIYFREEFPEDPQDMDCVAMEASVPSITDDPWFRQRCLELAIQNSTPGCLASSIARKAEAFAKYLKGETE